MRSVKMNQAMKDKLLKKIIKDKYEKLKDDFENKEHDFNERLYIDCMGKVTLEKMYDLPEGWLPESTEFLVYFEGGVYGGHCEPQLKEAKRFLSKHLNRGYVRSPLKIYDQNHKLYKEHEKISSEKESLKKEVNDTERNVRAIIESFNTTKQLCEAWPEIASIVENMFGEDVTSSKSMLPAVNMVDINKKLGFSK
jgi:hypothetical protein